METAVDNNIRKPGEMFTSSVLKKATPFYQFIFALSISLLAMLLPKYVWQSEELMMYSGCFGVVFYVMFNPWLALLADENKKYIATSVIFYAVIALVLYALIYFWTGNFFSNSMAVRITLITTTFYMVVAYGMMMILKFLFVDVSGGGL